MPNRFLLALLLLAASCSLPKGKLSSNEDRGIKEVTGTFGGRCEYGFRTSAGTSGKSHAFWMKISDCAALDHGYFPSNRYMASGAAYLFYSKLTNERSSYDRVDVEVHPAGKEAEQFSFPVTELAQVDSVLPFVQEVAGRLREKKYDGLGTYFLQDSVVLGVSRDSMLAELRRYTEARRFDEFQPTGYRFLTHPNGAYMLVVSGLLLTDGGQPAAFAVAVAPSAHPRKAYFANFALY
ncbi:hypothetical protein [Flaviaesturariibacter terrae]